MTAEATQERGLVHSQRKGLVARFAERFNLDPKNVLPVLRETIIPGGKASDEQIQVFLVVANEYELNPFTKEIYAFPTKGGGIQPIVGVDGWVKLIHKQKTLDGIEFESRGSGEKIDSVVCRIFRKDMSRPIEVEEFYAECERGTDPWKKWPARMLRHKSLIQCARVAFGFAGIVDEDEAERMKEVGAIVVESEPSPTAQRVHDRLRSRKGSSAPNGQPEPTDAELAEADKRREELKAQAAQGSEREDTCELPVEDEHGYDESSPESESQELPEPPASYARLYRAYDAHAKLVDECLKEVGLPVLPDVVWQDMDEVALNKLSRASAKFAKKISE